ncbi:MAG: PD-(D/E)XK nuclease superfamily protein [Pseudomonadota bacterium]
MILSGIKLEQEIEAGFRARGFEIIKARDWDQVEPQANDDVRKVILDAPYASIYGHAARIEFLMFVKGRRILIEVKRQRTSGSTDEKLPYVFANAKLNIGFGQEFILIMDGAGWKAGAQSWINDRAEETEGLTVFKPASFFQWLEAL